MLGAVHRGSAPTLHATSFNEQQIMLLVLALIDVAYYRTAGDGHRLRPTRCFVSRLRLQGHPTSRSGWIM